MKDASGSYAVSTEQSSSASQMTAAKVLDVIARQFGRAGQASDAVSAYTQVSMENTLLKLPKSEYPDMWIRQPRHKWSKGWQNIEEPVVHLERNLCGHFLAGLLWERRFEKIPLQNGWERAPNWECLFVHHHQGFFFPCTWTTTTWQGRNIIWSLCGYHRDVCQ